VFQDPHLLSELDALANVTLPGRIRGRPSRERGTAVVMVTHDEGLVHDVDARYRLEDGRLRPA
jgi:predicted ABC-type transport system involved in lysophospholipase L1 biosynthesis ATPase subunit